MSAIVRELRYALRMSTRRPVVAAIAIASLAICIGANTVVFSLISQLILRPLAVKDPRSLVSISIIGPTGEGRGEAMAWSLFSEIQKRQAVFAELVGRSDSGLRNIAANGLQYIGAADAVTGNYFPTLGIQPLFGRLIVPDDVKVSGGSRPIAVLSYRCWQQRYNGDRGVLGKDFQVDSTHFTIVGVTPESFLGLNIDGGMEATIPLGLNVGAPPSAPRVAVTARLKPGISLEEARVQINAVWPSLQADRMRSARPGSAAARVAAQRVQLDSASAGESFLRERLSRVLVILMASVATLLLVACLNLTSIMLASVLASRNELAVRVALGASVRQLAQPYFLQMLMLAFVGTVLGVGIAVWAGRFLLDTVWGSFYPSMPVRTIALSPDFRIVGFAAAVPFLVSLLVVMLPARLAARSEARSGLQQTFRSLKGRHGQTRTLLVGSQVALSLVLVIGAGLFSRSVHNIRAGDPGYRRQGVLVLQLFPVSTEAIPNRSAYYRDLAQRLASIHSVRAASFSNFGPVNRYELKEGVQVPSAPEEVVQATQEVIGSSFFRSVGMRVLEGRDFDWSDDVTRPGVVIVSENLAHRLFSDRSALGRKINLTGTDHQGMEIVGIVNNASLWVAQNRQPMAFYLPLMQEPDNDDPRVVLSTDADPAAVFSAARQTIVGLGRHTVLRMQTVEQRLDAVLTTERLLAILSGFLGATALVLVAIGLYGLISFSIAQRIPEIGVRMALGARNRDIVALMLRDVATLVLGGMLLGVVAALAASHIISGILYELSPSDPMTILMSCAILLAITMMAAYLPARHGSRIDPIVALRNE